MIELPMRKTRINLILSRVISTEYMFMELDLKDSYGYVKEDIRLSSISSFLPTDQHFRF